MAIKRKTKPANGRRKATNGRRALPTGRAIKAAVDKAVDAPAPVAALSVNDAIVGFRERAATWHLSTIALVASGSVCLIVAAFPSDKRSLKDYDTTVALLEKETAERGLKTAQIHKYIGLSRAVVDHMSKHDGPTKDVLACDDHDEAVDVLLAYFKANKVKSLDTLGLFVGKYARTPSKPRVPGQTPAQAGGQRAPLSGQPATVPITAHVRGAPATPEGNGNGGGPTGGQRLPANDMHIESPPLAGFNLADQLRGMQTATVVDTAVIAGHSPLAIGTAIIPLFTSSEDMGTMIRLLSTRAEQVINSRAQATQAALAEETKTVAAAPRRRRQAIAA